MSLGSIQELTAPKSHPKLTFFAFSQQPNITKRLNPKQSSTPETNKILKRKKKKEKNEHRIKQTET